MLKQATRRPCSFRTKAGRPCRAWAMRSSDPPACSSHWRASRGGHAEGKVAADHLLSALDEEALQAGFYDHTLSEDELADLTIHAADSSLADEIACTRIAVRRTLEFLNERMDSMSESGFLRSAGLVFQGARTIARLLREQQALTGGPEDCLQAIFDEALDGLSEEWGIEL